MNIAIKPTGCLPNLNQLAYIYIYQLSIVINYQFQVALNTLNYLNELNQRTNQLYPTFGDSDSHRLRTPNWLVLNQLQFVEWSWIFMDFPRDFMRISWGFSWEMLGFSTNLHQFHNSMDWFSRENLQENSIFNGKNHGFRLRFSLKPNHWIIRGPIPFIHWSIFVVVQTKHVIFC
jgi:hypothetical protein